MLYLLSFALHLSGVIFAAAGDPPAWGTLFADVGSQINDTITAVLPVAIPVMVTLASIGIAVGIFRKFGVKR